MTASNATLSDTQLRLLDVVSTLKSKEQLNGLYEVITNYLSQQLDAEMNRLWDEGALDEEKVEGFRQLHERTPYHKRTLL